MISSSSVQFSSNSVYAVKPTIVPEVKFILYVIFWVGVFVYILYIYVFFQCVGMGILLGTGQQKIAAIANLFGYYCIGLPSSIVLMFTAKLQVAGSSKCIILALVTITVIRLQGILLYLQLFIPCSFRLLAGPLYCSIFARNFFRCGYFQIKLEENYRRGRHIRSIKTTPFF